MVSGVPSLPTTKESYHTASILRDSLPHRAYIWRENTFFCLFVDLSPFYHTAFSRWTPLALPWLLSMLVAYVGLLECCSGASAYNKDVHSQRSEATQRLPLLPVCHQKSSQKAGRGGSLTTGIEHTYFFIHFFKATRSLTEITSVLGPSSNLGLGNTATNSLEFLRFSFWISRTVIILCCNNWFPFIVPERLRASWKQRPDLLHLSIFLA